jgi:hypothetical protein
MAADQNTQFEKMYKEMRQTRRRLYIPLIFMLVVAGIGLWASFQFLDKGEIPIPLPEQAASFISQKLNLGSDRKIGPIRLGSAPIPEETLEAPYQTPNEAGIKIPLPDSDNAGSVPPNNADADAGAPLADRSALPDQPTQQIQPGQPDYTDQPDPDPDLTVSTETTAPAMQSSTQETETGSADQNKSPDAPSPITAQTTSGNSAASKDSAAGTAAVAAPDSLTTSEIPEPSPVIIPPRPPKTLSAGRPQISTPDPTWTGKEAVTPYVPLAESTADKFAAGQGDATVSGTGNARRDYVRAEDRALFADANKPGPVAPMDKDGGPQLTVALSAAPANAKELIPVTFGPEATDAERARNQGSEDSVVTMGFIRDFAAYLTSCYWPAGTHPNYPNKSVSTANIKNVNQRYGVELWGLNGNKSSVRDYYRDRSLILNYVFMPSMLEALTRFYADRFANHLAQAGSLPIVDNNGRERRLTIQQNIAMLNYYSADARALSAALHAYAESPNAAELVAEYNKAANVVNDAHTKYFDAVVALEVASNNGNISKAEEARRNLAEVENFYHASLEVQRTAENAVYKMMLKGASTRLDSSSLVYIACWLNRRETEKETILAAAASANHIAVTLAAKAEAVRTAK